MLLVNEVLQLWGLVGLYAIGGGRKWLALRVLGVEYGWFSGDVGRKRPFFLCFLFLSPAAILMLVLHGRCLGMRAAYGGSVVLRVLWCCCVCRLGWDCWLYWVLRMGYFVAWLV